MSELLEIAFRAVRRIGDDFERPDDDWQPVLMYRTRNGDYCIAGLQMPDPGRRDPVAAYITELLNKHRCDEAVFIASCWGVTATADELLDTMSREVADLSSHPQRMEVLQICHVDREHAATYMAPITRDGSFPPVLGEFADPIENSDISGRFVDAIRAGIR